MSLIFFEDQSRGPLKIFFFYEKQRMEGMSATLPCCCLSQTSRCTSASRRQTNIDHFDMKYGDASSCTCMVSSTYFKKIMIYRAWGFLPELWICRNNTLELPGLAEECFEFLISTFMSLDLWLFSVLVRLFFFFFFQT